MTVVTVLTAVTVVTVVTKKLFQQNKKTWFTKNFFFTKKISTKQLFHQKTLTQNVTELKM